MHIGEDALDDRVGLGVHRGRVERIVAVHDAQEARRLLEGLVAEGGTLRSALRLVKGRWRRDGRRCCWQGGVETEMRVSSGTEAVFTSTPTAFTQSSTTASRLLASRDWLRSC